MESGNRFSRKKICVYTHLFPARSETFIREHVAGLARAGHRVVVVARQPSDDVAEDERSAIDRLGVERVYIGRFAWFSTKLTGVINLIHAFFLVCQFPQLLKVFRARSPWTIRELLIAATTAKFIRGAGFDVVHVHFGHLAACLHSVGKSFDRFPPLVVTWHGYDINVKPKQLGLQTYRALFDSPAVHTVGSEFTRGRLIGMGARPDRAVKIPMGVDVGRFAFADRQREVEAPFNILSVGRLEEVKGHSYLIDAIEKLRGLGLPVFLKIAGDGPLKDLLRARVQKAGLDDAVELLGAVDSGRVAQEMQQAHLFALTGVETASGKVESQGVVFAEAQATGLPVVASRLGGVPESLIETETGVLCSPRNVDEIVSAIQLFILHPNVAAEFGQHGRVFVEKNFSNELMVLRFDELYESLLPREHG